MKSALLTILVCSLLLSVPELTAATLFVGAYPNLVLVVDEGTGQILERITVSTGVPRSLRLSQDRKKIYVFTLDRSGIEVIDVATRKVIDHFTLDTPARRFVFAEGIVPDPAGKLLYTVTTQVDKLSDRFEVRKPKYTVIDLVQRSIARTVDIASEDESANVGEGNAARFEVSPDGKYLFQFRDKVIVLDTADFKVVDRMDLARPDVPGMDMENVGFGGGLDSITDPGARISLFNASDPVIHSRLFGIARFDLNSRQMNFTPIGPPPQGMTGLQVTPDKKKAYTVVSTGTQGNKRCEFWSFDLTANRITQTQEFSCRSRFSFGMSGDGNKLYIYAAGYEIEIYDAGTLKYERTWELTNDMTGPMVVVR
jgi:DNA-binding beta-propeller fold protein YncE